MQKENPVIKNYIISKEKRVLKEKQSENIIFDNLLYHLLLMRNKDFYVLFLLGK